MDEETEEGEGKVEKELTVYVMTDRFIDVVGKKLRIWKEKSSGEEYVSKGGKYIPIEDLQTAREIPQEKEKPKPKQVYRGVEIVEHRPEEGREIVPVAKQELVGEVDKFLIQRATDMSTILSDVIEKKKLFSTIQGKKFVRVEGWETLGALCKCHPQIISCIPIMDGQGYLAEAVVQRVGDNKILSRGLAMCTRKEKNWENRDDYALFSMAQTRAVGKAFRLGFSWIMSLAGYEPTPAEEM